MKRIKDTNGAKYSRDGKKLYTIPRHVEKFEVREGTRKICKHALYISKHGSNITEIVFPNSLTTIEDQAIMDCETITKIILPPNLIKIGKGVFWGCENIREVYIPKSVEKIGSSTFVDCTKIEKITIEKGSCFEIINGMLINWKTGLLQGFYQNLATSPEIIIPDGVKHIGMNAFSFNHYITKVFIPDSVITIGSCAFELCHSLTEVRIPNTIQRLGGCAFFDCSPTLDYSPLEGVEICWDFEV